MCPLLQRAFWFTIIALLIPSAHAQSLSGADVAASCRDAMNLFEKGTQGDSKAIAWCLGFSKGIGRGASDGIVVREQPMLAECLKQMDPLDEDKKSFCRGYSRGLADGSANAAANRTVCLPGAISARDLMQTIMGDLRSHHSLWDEDGGKFAYLSLAVAYPCPTRR